MGIPRTRRSPSPSIFLVAIVLFVILSATRSARAQVGCRVNDVRLANGLRVLICPNASASDVAVHVHYAVGAKDEPGSLAGIAHLSEHMMFAAGSTHVGPGDHLRLLSDTGATNLNGTTRMDATDYFETVPPERLALALWLESDRMGYLLPRLNEVALTRERAAVLNEYRDRVLDTTLGAVPGIIMAELFPAWHPYHHLPSGTPESIARIGLADVRAFLGTWYGPANATIAIAGPVDPSAAAALVQRYFASLPARVPPPRPSLPPLAALPPTFLRVGANVTRAEVRLDWITPPVGAPGDAELDLAAAILSEARAGWLQRRLRGMVARVTAAQMSSDLASVFEIRAIVRDPAKPVEVLTAIYDALARFDAGVSAEDMRRAQIGWYDAYLFRLEAIASWSAQLVRSPAQPSLGFFDGDLAKHSAITADRVRAAVRAHLDRAHHVVTLIQPAQRLASSGALIERKEVAR